MIAKDLLHPAEQIVKGLVLALLHSQFHKLGIHEPENCHLMMAGGPLILLLD